MRQRARASHQARPPAGILGPDLPALSSVSLRQVPPALLRPQEHAQAGRPGRVGIVRNYCQTDKFHRQARMHERDVPGFVAPASRRRFFRSRQPSQNRQARRRATQRLAFARACILAAQWTSISERFRSACSARISRLPGYLAARWLFLRALGLIFFSAFYSLCISDSRAHRPARHSSRAGISRAGGARHGKRALLVRAHRFLVVGERSTLLAVCIIGMIASILLMLNVFPRDALVVCLIAFLSFIGGRAGFRELPVRRHAARSGLSQPVFCALRMAARAGEVPNPPSRASRFLLVWLMFRIYFESGIAKMLGHDPEWRDFTAMDRVLPEWPAAHVDGLVRASPAARLSCGHGDSDAGAGAGADLRRVSAAALAHRSYFVVITPWQIGIILTSNYAFLNYLVLVLGFLLLDDRISGAVSSAKIAFSRGCSAGPQPRRRARRPPAWHCEHSHVGAGLFLDLDFLCHLGAADLHARARGAAPPLLPSSSSNLFASPTSSACSRS